jgi:putative transposase
VKFGLGIARRIRATALDRGDKWHLDEVVVTINGTKHWLWRAVDQHGAVLDVLVQSRRDKHAARLLMRKLLRKHGRAPRVLITDKLKSYAAANRELGLNVDHRQRKGDPARNSRTPISCSECMYLDSHRRLESQRCMNAFSIIKTFNPLDDIQSCLCASIVA